MAADADAGPPMPVGPALGMPTLPWHRPPKARRARRPLDLDLILATALRILDAEGLDALSMRRVAQELGTGPASLYAHVSSKDELLRLLFDHVSADIEVPAPDPDRWVEQARELLRSAWRTLCAHADIALLGLADIPTGPNAMRVAEGLLAILRAGGVPDKAAAWALDRLAMYMCADAFEDSLFLRKAQSSGETPEEFMKHYLEGFSTFLDTLPRDRFPNLVALHREMSEASGDEARFDFGLDIMLSGLAALAARGRDAKAAED